MKELLLCWALGEEPPGGEEMWLRALPQEEWARRSWEGWGTSESLLSGGVGKAKAFQRPPVALSEVPAPPALPVNQSSMPCGWERGSRVL